MDIRDVLAWAQLTMRTPLQLSFEGTIVADTYNPTDGSVQVLVGEAFSNFDSDDQLPFAITGQLTTPMLGLQGAPQGGERAILKITRGRYRIELEHDWDDSPNVPTGELHYLHYKIGSVGAGNTPVADSGFKVTNDGPTPGDGLGGSHWGEKGAHSTMDSNSGHQIELNDTSQQVKIKTAGGPGGANPLTETYDDATQTIVRAVSAAIFDKLDLQNTKITSQVAANIAAIIDGVAQKVSISASSTVTTIVDGAGNAISHVVGGGGKVALGALAGTGSLIPAISKTDLTTMLNDSSNGINVQRFADMVGVITGIHASFATAGVPSLPSLAAIIAALWVALGISAPSVPSFGSIPVPSGSSIVSMLP